MFATSSARAPSRGGDAQLAEPWFGAGLTLDDVTSPFERLRGILGNVQPAAGVNLTGLCAGPIDMTIGEPRHPGPAWLMERIAAEAPLFAKYPSIAGTPQVRAAMVRWLQRRYGVALDPESQTLILNGSREGLVSALQVALMRGRASGALDGRDVIAMPDPFYQPYLAGTLSAGGTPVFMPATPANGFLPDLDRLAGNGAVMERLAALIICSPSNPEGALADGAYWERAVQIARDAGALLIGDECYSEIYHGDGTLPPAGALPAAAAASRAGQNPPTGAFDDVSGVLVFNSLSKRSNLAGLRSGLVAGDPAWIERLRKYRNVACAQVPGPLQQASAALWDDEAHVGESRARYAEKFTRARVLLAPAGWERLPSAGFFLWLDVRRFGGGEKAAVTLWQDWGLKVLPGSSLCAPRGGHGSPGDDYVRIALVHDLDTTTEALSRLAAAATRV